MFDGQSLGNTPFFYPQTYPYKVGALLGMKSVTCNNSGTTYAQRNVGISSRVDSVFGRSIRSVLFDDGGTYDIDTANGALDTAATLAAMQAYTAARKAAGADKLIRLSIPPALILTAGEEATRVAVNAALKANPQQYGYDQFIDLMEVPALTNPNDASMYFDGTHWTDAATTLVANKIVGDLRLPL